MAGADEGVRRAACDVAHEQRAAARPHVPPVAVAERARRRGGAADADLVRRLEAAAAPEPVDKQKVLLRAASTALLRRRALVAVEVRRLERVGAVVLGALLRVVGDADEAAVCRGRPAVREGVAAPRARGAAEQPGRRVELDRPQAAARRAGRGPRAVAQPAAAVGVRHHRRVDVVRPARGGERRVGADDRLPGVGPVDGGGVAARLGRVEDAGRAADAPRALAVDRRHRVVHDELVGRAGVGARQVWRPEGARRVAAAAPPRLVVEEPSWHEEGGVALVPARRVVGRVQVLEAEGLARAAARDERQVVAAARALERRRVVARPRARGGRRAGVRRRRGDGEHIILGVTSVTDVRACGCVRRHRAIAIANTLTGKHLACLLYFICRR